jgi:hypothetical protein
MRILCVKKLYQPRRGVLFIENVCLPDFERRRCDLLYVKLKNFFHRSFRKSLK